MMEHKNISKENKNQPLVPFSVEVWAIAAIALGIFLRIINLGSREFWYDEVLSLLLSTGQKIAYQTPEELPVKLADYTALLNLPAMSGIGDVLNTVPNLLRGIVGGEPHPPLFYLSQHFWLYLFGNSEIAMRSLGMILSIGAIAIAYGLGKTLLGHRGGLLLAALFAINPFYLFHSLNLRMYGPLVLWVTLSALSLLKVIDIDRSEMDSEMNLPPKSGREVKFLWTLLLIGSVTAGCMTFYLFAYWMITLGAIVLCLDMRHWWQHGLRLGAGVFLTIPWGLWGTRQQLRNADFGRFDAPPGFLASMLKHLEDVASTLGIHLFLGDWITSLPKIIATIAGVFAIGCLMGGIIYLWQHHDRSTRTEASLTHDRRLLILGIIMGIFPLLLALSVDIISGKFTLGFGWGRSLIFILPGSLLLITILIERSPGRWRQSLAGILLFLYLSISIGDFTLRPREMFHQIAETIATQPNSPTLIAMNSRAWGHVMRLAYYISPQMPVMLLAQDAANLAPALEKVLKNSPITYDRILWLDTAAPIWSDPTTDAEKQAITKLLQSQFSLTDTQSLSGTMNSDEFTMQLYQKR